MKCVICEKSGIGPSHKCTKKGVKAYNQSLGGKAAARSKMDEARYGLGETIGDRITAGVRFMRGDV